MPLRAYDGVFAEVHGSDPPRVLALHGWGRRGADFDAVLDGLDALAVDLPGFGATAPPEHPIGAAGYAERLAPILGGLDAPVVVVGHSFGGRVGLCLAVDHPDRVSGLVLSGVPLLRTRPVRRPGPGYRLLRSAHRAGLVSDERMEQIRRSRGSADYRAATGVMRDVLVTAVNETYEDGLARLTVPVALVWGADDREAPVGVAEAAHRILDQAGVPVTLEVVAGVGHMLPVVAPGPLRAAIDRMLE
jgi:pimeloyl-ACP methyl ester carboxylesterase